MSRALLSLAACIVFAAPALSHAQGPLPAKPGAKPEVAAEVLPVPAMQDAVSTATLAVVDAATTGSLELTKVGDELTTGANRVRRPGGQNPNLTPEEREKLRAERRARMEAMTPEEREAFRARRQREGGTNWQGDRAPRGNRPQGSPRMQGRPGRSAEGSSVAPANEAENTEPAKPTE